MIDPKYITSVYRALDSEYYIHDDNYNKMINSVLTDFMNSVEEYYTGRYVHIQGRKYKIKSTMYCGDTLSFWVMSRNHVINVQYSHMTF